MRHSPKIGLLMSRLRVEEKWLMAVLEARGLDYDRIDDGEAIFDVDAGPGAWARYDVVLVRSIFYARGLY
ncbi:MAG: 30S ribosomal protein S6--L-glutamate ligase, partial [Chloroflexota bacterium]